MILETPINPLSIGNVGYNFARELWGTGKLGGVFAVANNFDFSAFEPVNQDFHAVMQVARQSALKNLRREDKVLKCWHLNDSHKRISDNQYLYTFYEVDDPTPEEVAIVNLQNHTFFSSSEAAEVFRSKGCKNVSAVPLGFDEDFAADIPVRKDSDKIHFILVGKWEQRKNTQRIIQLWLENYGNNNDYQLTCVVNNPFFKPEVYNQIVQNTLGGKVWSNINFLPTIGTNKEMAMIHQSADIDLSGLSNGEGWGLPAFNSTCLGKWAVVSNCSGHKDWANENNSILVEPSGKQPCYDNVFFHKGQPFNQGRYYKIEDDAIVDGIERALLRVGTENDFGKDLRVRLTYKSTIKQILDKVNE